MTGNTNTKIRRRRFSNHLEVEQTLISNRSILGIVVILIHMYHYDIVKCNSFLVSSTIFNYSRSGQNTENFIQHDFICVIPYSNNFISLYHKTGCVVKCDKVPDYLVLIV